MNDMTKAALRRDVDAQKIIRDAANLLRDYIKEIGGCDHRVGICCCADIIIIEKLEYLVK